MIQILHTDWLFKDSPDPGESDCKCSRCHNIIDIHDTVARIILNSLDLITVNKTTKFKTELADNPGLQNQSWEFRLCVGCNLKLLRQTTGIDRSLCLMAIEKFPNSFSDQFSYLKENGLNFKPYE